MTGTVSMLLNPAVAIVVVAGLSIGGYTTHWVLRRRSDAARGER